MMPPHCQLCRKRSRTHPDEKFELIRFKLTEGEEGEVAALKEAESNGRKIVGHPPGVHWFCAEHAQQVSSYKHLTWPDARIEISKPVSRWKRLLAYFRR